VLPRVCCPRKKQSDFPFYGEKIVPRQFFKDIKKKMLSQKNKENQVFSKEKQEESWKRSQGSKGYSVAVMHKKNCLKLYK